MYQGDFPLGETIHVYFTTRAFATGIPGTLSAATVAIYEDGTTTPIQTSVAVTESINSIAGLNMVPIVATGANGYDLGKSYHVVIEAGNVDSVSTAGEVIGSFTIGRTAAAVDLANATDGLGALKTLLDAIPTTAMRGTDSAAQAGDAMALTAGAVDDIYDEDVVAAHSTADTAGFLLRVLGKDIAQATRDISLLDQLRTIISVVESQRSAHTYQPFGAILYVDPVNGDTHASGNRGGLSDPYDSVQDAHDNAVTDSNHDLIILCAGAAGQTTMTEDVTLTKRYLTIRGPGRDFIWTRSGAGDTITITADGISLFGFQLETAATGAGNGVQITDADFAAVSSVFVNATRGDGVNILRGQHCIVSDSTFSGTGTSGSGQGVHIVGTAGLSNSNIIKDNIFIDPAGDGILIENGTTNDTHIFGNHIEGASGWGINIGASSTDAFVVNNILGNNSSGAINDNGTASVIENNEQQAKHSIATETRLAELDPANLPSDIDDILAKTVNLPTDPADQSLIIAATDANLAAIAALNDLAGSDVLTQVNAALDTAIAELGVAVPAATPTIRTALMLAYMALRNKYDVQTSGTDALEIHNSAGTQITKKLLSDDGSDYSEAKMS